MGTDVTKDLRQLAKEEPDAVKSVAKKAGGRIENRLMNLLEDEHGSNIIHDTAYIYVVKSDDGLYKIGKSKRPKSRIKSLSVGNPHELELIQSVEIPEARQAEKKLHDEYNDKRVRGEWYDLSENEIQNLVNRLENLKGIYED